MNAIKTAKTQAVFREVNERVRDLNDSVEHLGVADLDECFTCECARQDCMEHVKLSLGAYEEVRRVPTHFVVAPRMSHVFQDVERIFETHSRYWVVEKFGEAELARELARPSLAPPAGLSRRRKSQVLFELPGLDSNQQPSG